MGIMFTIIIEVLVILLIHFLFDFKKMNKIMIFLITFLLIFLPISFTYVFQDYSINWTSLSGIFEAVRVYFTWIISVLGNVKDITANIINMDWSP